MINTMIKEDGDGSPYSSRRILAFASFISAIALFIWAFNFSASGWYVFIPGLSLMAAVLILLFFTTWTDIAEAAAKIKGSL